MVNVNSVINKILGIVIAATIAAWLVLCWVMYANMRDKNLEIEALKMQLSERGKQQGIIAATIEKQNAAIEAARVDTVYVEGKIKEVTKAYETVRKEILHSVERDSTVENRLANIDNLLRRFSGVRAETGGKN
jgi:septal ring factor EnvC (AmiA/AmiB activator)